MDTAERRELADEAASVAARLRGSSPLEGEFLKTVKQLGRRLANAGRLQGAALLQAIHERELEQQVLIKQWEDQGSLPIINDTIDLGSFSAHAVNCLRNANVTTYGELRAKSAKQLLRVKHLGLGTLAELSKHLREKGLSLYPER